MTLGKGFTNALDFRPDPNQFVRTPVSRPRSPARPTPAAEAGGAARATEAEARAQSFR
jgi:hypothetical protein